MADEAHEERLTAFLYVLAHDYVAPGALNRIVADHLGPVANELGRGFEFYHDKHIRAWAADMAAHLLEDPGEAKVTPATQTIRRALVAKIGEHQPFSLVEVATVLECQPAILRDQFDRGATLARVRGPDQQMYSVEKIGGKGAVGVPQYRIDLAAYQGKPDD